MGELGDWCDHGSCRLAASQNRRVPSQPAEVRTSPPGENATPLTPDACPRKVWISSPVVTRQILTVVSLLDDAKRLPSVLKTSCVIRSSCPLNRTVSFPVSTSQDIMLFA